MDWSVRVHYIGFTKIYSVLKQAAEFTLWGKRKQFTVKGFSTHSRTVNFSFYASCVNNLGFGWLSWNVFSIECSTVLLKSWSTKDFPYNLNTIFCISYNHIQQLTSWTKLVLVLHDIHRIFLIVFYILCYTQCMPGQL